MPLTKRAVKKKKVRFLKQKHEGSPAAEVPEPEVRYDRLCPVCAEFERKIIRYHESESAYLFFNHLATIAEMIHATSLGSQLCALLQEGYLSAQIGDGPNEFTSKQEALQHLYRKDRIVFGHNYSESQMRLPSHDKCPRCLGYHGFSLFLIGYATQRLSIGLQRKLACTSTTGPSRKLFEFPITFFILSDESKQVP